MFKVALKVRSKKSDFTEVSEEKITDFLKTNTVGYEALITGNYIPYYDFDNKYATEEEQKNNYQSDLQTSYANVKLVFNKSVHKILSFDSCGHDPKASTGQQWKNSFHYRIRGAGYYESGTDIPIVEGYDDAVYKRKNSRQLMRLPFCSKEGNTRPLLRIIPETGTKYTIDEIATINEVASDYIIQNIRDEIKCESKKEIEQQFNKLVKCENKQINKMIKNKEVLNYGENGITVKNIDDLCDCLNKKRFNDRKLWLRFIRCLKNIGKKLKLDLTKIAHAYSSTSDKYNKLEVTAFYSNENEPSTKTRVSNSPPLGIGSLCYWAKNDNPEKYDAISEFLYTLNKNKTLMMIKKAEGSPTKYSFPDYTKFVNKKIKKEYELVKYLTDTVIHIIDGGNHKLFTRSVLEDGSVKFTPTDTNLFNYANNFEININGDKQKMNNYFLKNFYHVKNYNVIDFIPYLETDPCTGRTFNLFQGFQFPYVKSTPVPNTIPTEIELMFYHIKTIICDNNEVVYQYILNYITHLFQRPDEKIGIAILLQSKEHGTGKNRLTDFLMNCLGLHNVYKANKMEDVCASFNYHMQGKLLVVGDEIANYASHKFADLLKALITEVTKAITPKGKDSYTIASFERYIFTSNNDFAFRVEKGDRRLLPLRVSDKRKGDSDYFDKLSVIVDTPRLQEMFFNYMANRSITGWDFRKIPNTAMKSELILESLDPAIHFLIDFLNMQTMEIRDVFTKDLYTYYKDWCADNSHRPHSDRKFGKELNNINIPKVRKMKDNKRQYHYKLSKTIIGKQMATITKDASFKFEDGPALINTGLLPQYIGLSAQSVRPICPDIQHQDIPFYDSDDE